MFVFRFPFGKKKKKKKSGKVKYYNKVLIFVFVTFGLNQ